MRFQNVVSLPSHPKFFPAGYNFAERFIGAFNDGANDVKYKIASIYVIVIAANGAIWAWAWFCLNGHPVLIGTAALAYILGLRHALDADHIIAIDNVVRKLMQQRKAPVSAGLFFALGHSTVVLIASIILGIAATSVLNIGGLGESIASSVSALFLVLIGIANFRIVINLGRTVISIRSNRSPPCHDHNRFEPPTGMLLKIMRPVFGLIENSWHLYPVGFLFGLSFDTSTEVAILSISGSQTGGPLTPTAMLVFPALFAAGMAIVDTTDSVVMTAAYEWALVKPDRKLWYNLTITSASAIIAVSIGAIELLSLAHHRINIVSPVWSAIDKFDASPGTLGAAAFATFVLIWLISWTLHKLRPSDRRALCR